MGAEEGKKQINKTLMVPLSLTAGIIGLIQGIFWTVFSVLALCSYSDIIEADPADNEKVDYRLIYDIFFRESSSNRPSQVIVQPKELFIFSWFYLIFSVLWTCVSGCVIWGMIHKQWHLNKSLFAAWAGIVILLSIVDIVLTGLLINDYTVANDSNAKIAVVVCYGVIMSVAARGYILWIINIIFAIIFIKFVSDILTEDKSNTVPFIHGYESNSNPPWFNNSTQHLWTSPKRPQTEDYDNHGFERSQSFFTPDPIETNTSNPETVYNNVSDKYPNFYRNNPISNNNITQNSNNAPSSFAEAIAQKTATIGRNRNKGRSPLNPVSPPFIPDPDYTPPGSPNHLKSVLRAKSKYDQPMF